MKYSRGNAPYPEQSELSRGENRMSKKRILHLLILTAVVLSMNAVLVSAQSGISIVHYYSDALGQEVMGGILQAFNEANPDSPVADNSAGNEDFMTQIQVKNAGDMSPYIFTSCAGSHI